MTSLETYLISGLSTLVVGVLSWWINDLKDKQKRSQFRVDEVTREISGIRDKITYLQAASITEPEVLKLMNDMERRVMSEFKGFRLEFKEDLKEFRDVIKEDRRSNRQARRMSDREDEE